MPPAGPLRASVAARTVAQRPARPTVSPLGLSMRAGGGWQLVSSGLEHGVGATTDTLIRVVAAAEGGLELAESASALYGKAADSTFVGDATCNAIWSEFDKEQQEGEFRDVKLSVRGTRQRKRVVAFATARAKAKVRGKAKAKAAAAAAPPSESEEDVPDPAEGAEGAGVEEEAAGGAVAEPLHAEPRGPAGPVADHSWGHKFRISPARVNDVLRPSSYAVVCKLHDPEPSSCGTGQLMCNREFTVGVGCCSLLDNEQTHRAAMFWCCLAPPHGAHRKDHMKIMR